MTVDGIVIRCDRFGCRTEATMDVPSEVPMTNPGLAYEVRWWFAMHGWRDTPKGRVEARGDSTIVHCTSDSSPHPLNGIQVRPMTVARFYGVSPAGTVFDPAPPHGEVRTVLGVDRPVLGLDEPDAALQGQAEGFGAPSRTFRV